MKSQISNPKPQIDPKLKIPSEKIYNLRERLLAFSKKVLALVKRLPRSPECDVIRKQLSASAMSIGANYEEADASASKRDFINKVVISRKEASEAAYWLDIISGTYISEADMAGDVREILEIRRILSTIINKVKGKQM